MEKGSEYHIPAMFHESMEYLAPERGGIFADCTLGGGGHSEGILKALGGKGRLIGIDQDDEALAKASEKLGKSGCFIPVKGNFGNIESIFRKIGESKADGFLFDLGVSSHQLDSAERGFSFKSEAALDMRMDRTGGITAADAVNSLSSRELERIFWEYGEEKKSRRMAMAIEEERKKKPFRTTSDLASLAEKIIPFHRSGSHFIHPATRIFMALRIYVNRELEQLRNGLMGAFRLANPGARIVVISYHSLEDRIVKNIFRDMSYGEDRRDAAEYASLTGKLAKRLTKKVVIPSEEEQRTNPRSRSAKLRACEIII